MKKQLFTIGTALMFVLGAMTITSCGGGSSEEAGHQEETELKVEGEHEGNDQSEDATHQEEASHEGHDHGDADLAMATYQCPMDCEKGKTYDEAGKCPVCKMDLKEVEAAE